MFSLVCLSVVAVHTDLVLLILISPLHVVVWISLFASDADVRAFLMHWLVTAGREHLVFVATVATLSTLRVVLFPQLIKMFLALVV
jgi:hypothetical protein